MATERETGEVKGPDARPERFASTSDIFLENRSAPAFFLTAGEFRPTILYQDARFSLAFILHKYRQPISK
jgi:hypothetical protein